MKRPRYLGYSKMYSIEYRKFAKSLGDGKGYTRNQMKFAEYLLSKRKEISVLGNMEIVFGDVRNYLKGLR